MNNINENAKQLMTKHNEDLYKIYELNGIIENILVNGKVNMNELKRLKHWMSYYRFIIDEYKFNNNLIKIIILILQTKKVTISQQEQMMDLIGKKVSDSKLNQELDLLYKKVRSGENIGIYLIDRLENDIFTNEIHKYAQNQIELALESYTQGYVNDWEIVFISLVIIAMLKYDGSFYDKVEETYNELYNSHSRQKIEGTIRNILSRYDTNRTNRTRLINVVLSNAIVPCYYLPAFFEFIYDIYKLNFEYELVDNLYEEFKFVYEGLRHSILLNDDDVKINVTKKAYKLIKSTKQLIIDNSQLDSIIKISIIIVEIIDNRFWGKKNTINNTYLKAAYEEWSKTLKDDNLSRTYNRSQTDFQSRWETKYILESNEIYLVTPIHKIKSEYDYRNIKVIISNHDKDMYVKTEPDIREIIGGYQVNIGTIKIKEPLGNVNYKLLAGNDVIYDSKEKLYRDFIVFDMNGNEINNNSDYSGTAIFCHRYENEKLKPFYKCKSYMISSLNVKEGSTYIIDDLVFNFSSLIKPGIIGEIYEDYYLTSFTSEDKIPIYSKVQFLMFESNSACSNYAISINGTMHRLSDYKVVITERDSVRKYVVHLDIHTAGIYFIIVYGLESGRKNKLFRFYFGIDASLKFEEYKMSEFRYMIQLTTDLNHSKIVNEIDIRDIQDFGISILYENVQYKYYLPFDFDIYRITGSKWISLSQSICIQDITQDSVLDIYGHDIEEMMIFSSEGKELVQSVYLKDNGLYKQVQIGFLMSYKVNHDYIKLVFKRRGSWNQGIYCYNKCVLNQRETEFIFEPLKKELLIKPSYYGRGKVYLVVSDSKGNIEYTSDYIKNGEIYTIQGLESFKKYNISFWEKEKGLLAKRKRKMMEFERIFYAYEDFVGQVFKISKVYYDQYIKGKFIRKYQYFNTSYVKFVSRTNENIYSGEIFSKTFRGRYFLTKINPVTIEICSEVIDNTMELVITKDGDGLFLDFEHHNIKNTLYDDSATDIFSYIVEMIGVE